MAIPFFNSPREVPGSRMTGLRSIAARLPGPIRRLIGWIDDVTQGVKRVNGIDVIDTRTSDETGVLLIIETAMTRLEEAQSADFVREHVRFIGILNLPSKIARSWGRSERISYPTQSYLSSFFGHEGENPQF